MPRRKKAEEPDEGEDDNVPLKSNSTKRRAISSKRNDARAEMLRRAAESMAADKKKVDAVKAKKAAASSSVSASSPLGRGTSTLKNATPEKAIPKTNKAPAKRSSTTNKRKTPSNPLRASKRGKNQRNVSKQSQSAQVAAPVSASNTDPGPSGPGPALAQPPPGYGYAYMNPLPQIQHQPQPAPSEAETYATQYQYWYNRQQQHQLYMDYWQRNRIAMSTVISAQPYPSTDVVALRAPLQRPETRTPHATVPPPGKPHQSTSTAKTATQTKNDQTDGSVPPPMSKLELQISQQVLANGIADLRNEPTPYTQPPTAAFEGPDDEKETSTRNVFPYFIALPWVLIGLFMGLWWGYIPVL